MRSRSGTFEHRLKERDLYRLWNRMSSGSYMPPPVRTVSIPKAGGGERRFRIPTVMDRVAQMVVKMQLEPHIEPLFHEDSYGYRLFRSAHDALGRARQRCWQYDWVIDLDIKGFFDSIPHDLLLGQCASTRRSDGWCSTSSGGSRPLRKIEKGGQSARRRGTPQGGVISPLLANIFLHYALDRWMDKHHPRTPFERYADNAIAHCRTKGEAKRVLGVIRDRLAECGLELNLQKTHIVYCKDANRPGVTTREVHLPRL